MEGNTLIHTTCGHCEAVLTEDNWSISRRSRNQRICKACDAAATKQWQIANPTKTIFNNKKRKAKELGIEFTITFDEIQFPTHCPILGIELLYDRFSGKAEPRDNSPSFDRIDPMKGYVSGNVIIISNRANRIKNNATVDELKKVAAFLEQLNPPVGGMLNAANDNQLVHAAVA